MNCEPLIQITGGKDIIILPLFYIQKRGEFMAETTEADNESKVIKEPWKIELKIGMTTYEVSLHFSKTSTESMGDKLMRLLENYLSIKNF